MGTSILASCASGTSAAAPPRADRTTSAPSAKAASATTKERGHVIECTGMFRGQDVWVSVYENDTFANVFQVVIGGDGTGASREVKDGFVDHGDARGSLRLKGERVTVNGTAKRVGPRIPVHAEHDDAGQHITETATTASCETSRRKDAGRELRARD